MRVWIHNKKLLIPFLFIQIISFLGWSKSGGTSVKHSTGNICARGNYMDEKNKNILYTWETY
jgi:hypothetical protein